MALCTNDIRKHAKQLSTAQLKLLLIGLLEDRENIIVDTFRSIHGKDALLDKDTQRLIHSIIDAERRIHDIG